ncbi:hypothetical protein CPLU01_05264 [Colletotrichum plurivorum]|uniref:Uncharacterized protein n=1 Tax=Colletotrichum plurivorum TaxID=2175906 RepID=A0A8H6KLY6_9PEZI|nr:hypothetical protein CPLU01_05264 [Colletotrichum plurivorum]
MEAAGRLKRDGKSGLGFDEHQTRSSSAPATTRKRKMSATLAENRADDPTTPNATTTTTATDHSHFYRAAPHRTDNKPETGDSPTPSPSSCRRPVRPSLSDASRSHAYGRRPVRSTQQQQQQTLPDLRTRPGGAQTASIATYQPHLMQSVLLPIQLPSPPLGSLARATPLFSSRTAQDLALVFLCLVFPALPSTSPLSEKVESEVVRYTQEATMDGCRRCHADDDGEIFRILPSFGGGRETRPNPEKTLLRLDWFRTDDRQPGQRSRPAAAAHIDTVVRDLGRVCRALTIADPNDDWPTAIMRNRGHCWQTALASSVGRGAESDLQLTHAATHDAF